MAWVFKLANVRLLGLPTYFNNYVLYNGNFLVILNYPPCSKTTICHIYTFYLLMMGYKWAQNM
jgi:hypothetical protein